MKFNILAIICLTTAIKGSVNDLTQCDDKVSYSRGHRCFWEDSTDAPETDKNVTNVTFPPKNDSSTPMKKGATESQEGNESSYTPPTTTSSKNELVDEGKIVPINDSRNNPDAISKQNLTTYILQISDRFNFVSFLYFLDKNILRYALGGSIFEFLEHDKETRDRHHYMVAVGLYFSALNHCVTYSAVIIVFVFKRCIKFQIKVLSYVWSQTVLALKKSYFYCTGRKEDLGEFKSFLGYHQSACLCCNCVRYGPLTAVSSHEHERLKGANAVLRSELRIAQHKLPNPHQLVTTVISEAKDDLFFPPAASMQKQEKRSFPYSQPQPKTAKIKTFPQMKLPWKAFGLGGNIKNNVIM